MSQKLLEMIEDEVNANPKLLGEIFKYISQKWELMVETQRNERESSHRYALREMVLNTWSFCISGKKSPKLFSNLECCTLLEAADAIYVNGNPGAASPAERELLQHLSDSISALGWKPEEDFIRHIRKKEAFLKGLYENFPPRSKA